MKYLKKLLIVFTLLMILVGCGKKTESSEVVENDTTAETEKVEARTAIIFKQIDNKTVSVKRDNETLESYEGMRLLAGDKIITGEDTTVYIRVDDDKNILLDNQTTMAVNELSNGKLVMYLEEGAFFFDLENKLADGEEVSFDLGGTTMSIRGTSGQGSRRENSKSFAIFTGLGSVTDNNGMEAELQPNTKVEFISGTNDDQSSFSFNIIQFEDILGVTKGYVEDNADYQNKVENSKWAQEITGKTTGNADDGSDQLNGKPGTFGWIQQADGSWIFSQEAYNNKTESSNYVKPSSNYVPSYTPATVIADPEPDQDQEPAPAPAPAPQPEPEPAPSPTPEPAPQPEPGPEPAPGPIPQNICGHCSKEIEAGKEGLHALMGSPEAQTYLVAIFGSGSQLATMTLCHTHYLCELNTISFDSLIPHSVASEQGKIYIWQKYETQLSTKGIDYTALMKLNFCTAHGICEMGLDQDIDNLLLHIAGNCSGCAKSFHLSDLLQCTECTDMYCSECLNNLSDGTHEYVNGVLKHKE